MSIGIYKITNVVNNKSYIGSSINIENRKKEHFKDLRKNKHHNKYLQNSYNKYGENFFSFEILKLCNKEDLFKEELNYIVKYNSLITCKGYNIAIPQINEVHSQFNSIKILGICIKTNKILKEFNSIAEISRIYKITSSSLSKYINKENRSYKGMRLIYKSNYDINKDYKNNNKKTPYKLKGRFKGNKIIVMNLEDKIILELENTKSAAKYFNTSEKYIGKVTRGEKKTIKGFKLKMQKSPSIER